jgi:hypothetical protein
MYACIQILEDNFGEVAAAVLAAYDSGELAQALEVSGGFKKWANALGKAQKRKGKRLFMPLRIALTVSAVLGGRLVAYAANCAMALGRLGGVAVYGSCLVLGTGYESWCGVVDRRRLNQSVTGRFLLPCYSSCRASFAWLVGFCGQGTAALQVISGHLCTAYCPSSCLPTFAAIEP